MKTKLDKLSDTKVKLTVTLGEAELDSAKQVALKKLSRNVRVPGFRKGRAPLNIVEGSLDQNALQEEILNNALSKAVAEAFIDQKLQALDRPSVEVLKFVPGQELEFTAESEIIPEVKLGDYRKLKSKLVKPEVTEKEVDEIIQRMK